MNIYDIADLEDQNELFKFIECYLPPNVSFNLETLKPHLADSKTANRDKHRQYYHAYYFTDDNDEIIGYFQMCYLHSRRSFIIDTLVIKPGEKIFKEVSIFIKYLFSDVYGGADVYTEISKSNVALIRLLKMHGFSILVENYLQPDMESGNICLDGRSGEQPYSSIYDCLPCVLMGIVKDAKQISLRRLIETIYIDHYYMWYSLHIYHKIAAHTYLRKLYGYVCSTLPVQKIIHASQHHTSLTDFIFKTKDLSTDNHMTDSEIHKRIEIDSKNHNLTKHEVFVMGMCGDLAKQSYCERSQMGAVIMVDDKTFVTGYNGTLEGFENKCDEVSLVCNVCNVAVDPNDYVEGEQHCKRGFIEKRPKSTLNVIHAETNAIFHAGINGISVVGKTMCMTTSPCATCANNIVKVKIGMIIFSNYHDDLRGLETLIRAGVKVIKYDQPVVPMIRIRRHAALLIDSMETTKKIPATTKAVMDYLSNDYFVYYTLRDKYELKVTKYCGPDDRIDWDETYVITINGNVVGFTDGPVSE